MDAAPVMILVSGADKLFIWFNRPWLKFTGRAFEQELGNGWTEGVHPDDFHRCLDIYTSRFDAREPFRMQYRLRHHNGHYRWIDDSGIPRIAQEGPSSAISGRASTCMNRP
jgi:PAS domain S-box-containing protein